MQREYGSLQSFLISVKPFTIFKENPATFEKESCSSRPFHPLSFFSFSFSQSGEAEAEVEAEAEAEADLINHIMITFL